MKSISPLFFVLIFLFIVSCTHSNLQKPYEFSNGWKNGEVVKFDFKVSDSKTNQDLFLILRHNKNYQFSNIFLITEFQFEKDSIKTDTLEYRLSANSGKWLGEQKLSIVEHKLPFKMNLELQKDSLYTLQIRNSMRLNNEISPIQNLENVLDLGLLMEIAK